jgi:hypothetical protein
MAVWRDIDSDVRINGSLVLPSGSLTIGGNNVITLINGKVGTSRSITAGTGLTGGGDFTADRTISVNFGTAADTVAEGNHGHAISGITGLTDALAGKASTTHNHNTVYLGINATAADSNKLNGQLASYYATSSALTAHTGDATIHKSWGNWDTATNDFRVNAKILLSHNTTTNKVFINPGKAFAGVDIVGSATVDGNGIWHAGNLSKTDFITTTDPATVVSGFTVNGRMYAGTSTAAGSILVKDSAFQETIHIGGKTIFDETKIKTWISETGYARFKNTVRVSGLEVDTSSMVTNLNAEYLSGNKADAFVRAISVRDIAGYGVSHGYAVTDESTTSNSVTITPGLVITDSGKRYETAQVPQLALAGAPGSGLYRIDVIYIRGSKTKDTNGSYISTGVNEGTIGVYQGPAVSGTPTAPYTQLYDEYPGAIPLAEIYRPPLIEDIDAGKITDVRKYAAVTSPNDATVEVRRKLNVSGEVSATKFNGSGAGLTSIPVNQFGTNRIVKTNLDTSTMYLNDAQTITANKTFSTGANLYFAGGTSYWVNTAGSARFNQVNVVNDLVVDKAGNWSRIKFPAQTNDPGEITHYEDNNAAVMYFSVSDDPLDSDHFSFGSRIPGSTYVEGAKITALGNATFKNVTSTGLTVNGDTEIAGELKTGGANEFPDSLVASGSAWKWSELSSSVATVQYDSTQVPSGTGAVGSIKVTASGDNAYAPYNYDFPVSPGEWITFSCYLFSTSTGKQAQLYIEWLDATNTRISIPGIALTAPTSWGRHRITEQAPANATKFKVRVDNDGGAGTTMYFSAFQVERGRAMTGFNPHNGGKHISMYYDGTSPGIYADSRININQAITLNTNNDFIIKSTTTDAGDVVFQNSSGTELGRMWAGASGLLLSGGSTPTASLQISGTVVTISAATLKSGSNTVVDTSGKLYYQNADIDSRYLKLADGGTVAGGVAFNGSVTLNSGATWKPSTNITMTPTVNSQEWSFDFRNVGTFTGNYWQVWTDKDSIGTILSATADTARVGVRTPSPSRTFDVNGDAKIRTTLEVGNGTAANDLVVTSGGAFNWRNTIYSGAPGKVSINKTSNSEQPLDVKSNGSYLGINIERTATTDVSGLSWRNADGNYTTHLAARDAGNGRTHLSLYSGINTSMSALTENFSLYDNGEMWVRSNIKTPQNLYVGGGSGLNHSPSIDLAIGDSDTGFNWISDGKFHTYNNNVATIEYTNTQTTFLKKVDMRADLWVTPDGDNGARIQSAIANGYGFVSDYGGNNVIISNEQGTANQAIFLGDTSPTSGNTLFGVASTTSATSAASAPGDAWSKRFEVTGTGEVKTEDKVTIKSKFSIDYNATEDSLDFVYNG